MKLMKKNSRSFRIASVLLALLLCAGLTSLFALADGEPSADDTAVPADVPTDTPEPTIVPDEPTVIPDEPIDFPDDPKIPIIIDPVLPTPFHPPVCPIPEDFLAEYMPGDLSMDFRHDFADAAFMLRYILGLDRENWTDSKTVKVGDISGNEQLSTLIESEEEDGPTGITYSSRDGVVDMTDVLQVLYNMEHPMMPVMAVSEPIPVCKPVLYLYPTETTDVTVTLENEDALTTVYPAYDGGWTVAAQPDGTLTGPTGRTYYSLYYEADVPLPDADGSDGFVVARDDVADFLEEKLALLGLTEREAEEMIIYWLPRLQQTEYVFVRFASAEAIAEAMPLNIDPAPDTLIRVWMLWRGLEGPLDVTEQALVPVSRDGFVAVEWGGAELE